MAEWISAGSSRRLPIRANANKRRKAVGKPKARLSAYELLRSTSVGITALDRRNRCAPADCEPHLLQLCLEPLRPRNGLSIPCPIPISGSKARPFVRGDRQPRQRGTPAAPPRRRLGLDALELIERSPVRGRYRSPNSGSCDGRLRSNRPLR